MSTLTKKEVRTDAAPALKPFYSQGVVGNIVYVSGSLEMDPNTSKIVEGTIADRITQILKNISNILEAAGISLANLVRVNIFIIDMKNFNAMNEAYIRAVHEGVKAVRTCVAVNQPPLDTDVEIEAIAHFPSSHLWWLIEIDTLNIKQRKY
ncbi:Endoribonuclease L-PSP/chorismate mutase-like protein [Dactylonectria macrodidyma]|uniref:Endoribonuclease L-PSP/chorismate mutase-like protein n=1 Tax=Dactylonectria macrodidyma TaxID=307937 RepID=A0A9P9EPW8_9HYPO|nr:Endoribonuclease L-PSP/chorismate mutase-like protein [Dactylonectria macrodidyma]